MRFRFYEVGWDEDNVGGANRYVCTDSLADARKAAKEQAESEAASNLDDDGLRIGASTVVVQEYIIVGTPKQVAADHLRAVHRMLVSRRVYTRLEAEFEAYSPAQPAMKVG